MSTVSAKKFFAAKLGIGHGALGIGEAVRWAGSPTCSNCRHWEEAEGRGVGSKGENSSPIPPAPLLPHPPYPPHPPSACVAGI